MFNYEYVLKTYLKIIDLICDKQYRFIKWSAQKADLFWRQKFSPGVDFTNVLWATFTCKDS